jgi:hypothetical protein
VRIISCPICSVWYHMQGNTGWGFCSSGLHGENESSVKVDCSFFPYVDKGTPRVEHVSFTADIMPGPHFISPIVPLQACASAVVVVVVALVLADIMQLPTAQAATPADFKKQQQALVML